MNLPKLYAHDKNNNIKVWWVTTDGNVITVHHGQDGGKIQTQFTSCEPKNVGRANESTSQQQAESEAQSKWNKQIKKGYVEDKDNIPTNTLPPLAKKYQDAGHRITWPADVLCKLNGVRCTKFFMQDDEVLFQSRGGDPYPVIESIAQEMKRKVFDKYPKYVVDCELYSHGMFLEDITSAVKKHNKNTPLLEAHVFDMLDPDRPDMPWTERYAMYVSILDDWMEGDKVIPVYADTVQSEEDMIRIHDRLVDEGYEGVVIRQMDETFKFDQRCAGFQKYKIPLSAEFKVVDVLKDKNDGGIPVCEVKVFDSPDENHITAFKMKTFKAPFAGTHEFRKELFENRDSFIDGWLTVDFEQYSKYGIPAKPIGKAFRDMDVDGNPLI